MRAIRISFEPTAGYWDGGVKSGGTFTPRVVEGGYEDHEKLKQHVQWECFELNHWFRTPLKNAEAVATRYLRKTKGLTALEYV